MTARDSRINRLGQLAIFSIFGSAFLKLKSRLQEYVVSESNAPVVTCSVCSKPVSLEKSVTDEDGRAAHADCYLQSVRHKPGMLDSPMKAVS